MQDPTWSDLCGHESGEIGVDNTSLVMPFLGPGVGEKQLYGIQGFSGNHGFEYLHGICADDADIRQPIPFDKLQQMAYAGSMDLNADKAPAGLLPCHLGKRLTISKADLQCKGQSGAEQSPEIQEII